MLVTFALGASVAFAPLPAARAQDTQLVVQAAGVNNSYRLFYDKLANDGDWFQTDDYGFVFQPRVAAEDKTWRPYTDGYWAQTDAGWAWVSNEDFGWACYHYGRWANLVDVGWVWVPSADWSPGYVSWRVSRDHKRIGWAPLPPEAIVSNGQAIESWVDTAYDIGPDAYTFINTTDFGENSYRAHLLPVGENVSFITETDNVTRVDYRNVESRSVIYDGGPDVAFIRESGGRPVRVLRLETRPENVEYFERGDRRRYNEVSGDRLVVAVAAADVITSNTIRFSEPARINRRLSNVAVDRGYQGIRDPQQVERIRTSLRSQGPPPPPQIERAASAAIRRDGGAGAFERNGQPGRNGVAPGFPGAQNGQPGRNEVAPGFPGGQNGQPGRGGAAPGAPRNEVAPGAPRGEATPGVPRNVGVPSTPRNGIAPGSPRNEVTPGNPRNEAAPGAPGAGTNPAAQPAPTPAQPAPGNRRRPPSPEAAPAATPGRPAAEAPGATPETGRNGRQRPGPAPEAAPESTPTRRVNAPEAAPASSPAHRGNTPEGTAAPAPRSRENAAPERTGAPVAAPSRRENNAGEEKPAAKPEAAPRPPTAEAERRHGNAGEEKPAARSEAEKRPAPNAEAAAPRRETERSAPANEPKERPAAGEKPTPKP